MALFWLSLIAGLITRRFTSIHDETMNVHIASIRMTFLITSKGESPEQGMNLFQSFGFFFGLRSLLATL